MIYLIKHEVLPWFKQDEDLAGEVGLGTLSPLARPELNAAAELASAVAWRWAGSVGRARDFLKDAIQ
jgi:hypothetical protein